MRLDLVLPNEGAYGLEAMNAGPHYEAMGWEGIHLYDFQLRAGRYGSWEVAASSPDGSRRAASKPALA